MANINLSLTDGFSLSDELPFTPGSSGWLPGWLMRKLNPIGGTTAGMQFNYQMKITVHKGSGTDSATDVYCNGHCRDDFGDIRWTRGGGLNLLDYWIESVVSGDKAVFWVEVPFVPKSPGTVDARMYYDKSDAASLSNGDATFIFFDDFAGTTINTNKWTVLGGYHSQNEVLKATDGPSNWTDSGIISNSSFARPFVLEFKMRCTAIGSPYTASIFGTFSSSPPIYDNQKDGWDEYNSGTYPYQMTLYENHSSVWTQNNYWSLNTWYKLKIVVKSSGITGFIDDSQKYDGSGGSTSPLYIGNSNYDGNQEWDDVRVRKYASPEPAWGAWGAQDIYEALTDAFSLADALSLLKSRALLLALTDTLALADVATVLRAKLVVLLDAFTHADLIAALRARRLEVTDPHTLADITSTQETYYRTLTSAFTLADVALTQETYLRTLTDAHTLADAVAALRARRLVVADPYALADTASTQEAYYRALTDAYGLADIVSTLRSRRLALADAFALADLLSTLRARRLTPADGYGLADLTSFQEVYHRVLTDAYTLADPAATLLARRMVLTDGFTLADTLSESEAYYRALADAYYHADPLQTRETYYRALADAYALADTALARRNPVLLAKLLLKLIRLVDLEGGF